MSAGDSNYTVGRGKPPLHTRFQKGQSGNPSGKPGPAKLARQRFQRALHAALDAETADLKDARPRVNLEVMVRRLMLDAAGGDRGAMKLILSELDHEIAREEPGPPDRAKRCRRTGYGRREHDRSGGRRKRGRGRDRATAAPGLRVVAKGQSG